MLGLKFAYATNGHEIIEIDYFTGRENRSCTDYPTPEQLWQRYRAGSRHHRDRGGCTAPAHADQSRGRQGRALLPADRHQPRSRRRSSRASGGMLLTMATGTGKTAVAFQICWKLWNARWNRTGEHRKPRILYLADRNILIDDPKDKDLRAVRRCPLQDRVRRGGQEPRDVFRHLSGARRGRAPRRAVPRVSTRFLRSRHRGRVPPRQRARTDSTGAPSSTISSPPTSSA